MRSRSANADHEQTGSVGASDDFLAIQHDGRVGLDCDAHQPGFRRQLDGAESNRRLVDTAFLTGLLNLDQHPAGAFTPQCGASPQKFVSPLYGFDAEHEALLNDHRLADIEIPQGLSDPQSVLDISLRLPVR